MKIKLVICFLVLQLILFTSCSSTQTNNAQTQATQATNEVTENNKVNEANKENEANEENDNEIKNEAAQINYYDKSKIIGVDLEVRGLDTDGDGLSDFEEMYKYFTDYNNSDSDNDGLIDSDWEERRENAYTLYTKLQLVGPLDINSLNNDYQDAKIIDYNDEYVECEIIFYPENTIKTGIGSNDDWGNYGPEFDEYLKPYIYANWDEEMQADLIKELNDYGIDKEVLSDKELVQKVAIWIRERNENVEYKWPAQFFLRYDESGKFYLDDEFRRGFEERVLWDKISTVDDAVNKIVLGKEMFYNKTVGGCTSSTTYAATIYRALGIPTRHVFTTKILFPPNLNVKVNELKNPLVKDVLISSNQGSSNHTYNEVYIDGRWIRIDYDELGAGSIWADRGLRYQHYSPNDISDLDMVEEYGSMISDPKWGPFKNGEFFKLIDISDNYGKYYKPVYPYNIDSSKYDKFIVFGEREFNKIIECTALTELRKFKLMDRVDGKAGNISNFKEEYLNDNNIIIVSADIDYNKLPNSIKNNISSNEYKTLKADEYKSIEINESVLLIIKKEV